MDEETGYVELVQDIEKNDCCPYYVSQNITYVLVLLSGSVFIVLFGLLIHKYYVLL